VKTEREEGKKEREKGTKGREDLGTGKVKPGLRIRNALAHIICVHRDCTSTLSFAPPPFHIFPTSDPLTCTCGRHGHDKCNSSNG